MVVDHILMNIWMSCVSHFDELKMVHDMQGSHAIA